MGKSYAVLGLGKFGKSVALNLMKDGAEVLAVDQKEELVRDIVDYVTCAVCADVTDMEVDVYKRQCQRRPESNWWQPMISTIHLRRTWNPMRFCSVSRQGKRSLMRTE